MKTTRVALGWLIGTAFALQGCTLSVEGPGQPGPPLSGTGADGLLDREWALRTMVFDGAEVELEQGVTTTIQFTADGRFGGSGGCNSYSGSFVRDGSTISLGPAEATLMACLVGGEQESAFFSALPQISAWEIGAGELRLSSADGRTVLTFEHGGGG